MSKVSSSNRANATAQYYTRAVKLKLDGCLCSKKEVDNIYSNKNSLSLKLTRKKLGQVNELGSSMTVTVNTMIRLMYSQCLNVSQDLRELSLNEYYILRHEQYKKYLTKTQEIAAKKLKSMQKSQASSGDSSSTTDSTPIKLSLEDLIQQERATKPFKFKPPLKFALDAWTLLFIKQALTHPALSSSFVTDTHVLECYLQLSERAKSQCLKKALEMLKAVDNSEKERVFQAQTKKRKAKCPVLRHDAGINLDAKFASFDLKKHGQVGIPSFDVILNLSVIGGKKGGKRLVVPLKSTQVLNDWLNVPGADLIDGCELYKGHVIVYVRVPVTPLLSDSKSSESEAKAEGSNVNIAHSSSVTQKPARSGSYREQLLRRIKVFNPGSSSATIELDEIFALDLGINKPFVLTNVHQVEPSNNPMKLLDPDFATTDQAQPDSEEPKTDISKNFSCFFGQAWQNVLLDKRLRKKWGSKAFKRAAQEHRNLLEMELNHLFKLTKGKMKILIIENLTNIKKYKSNKKVLLWIVSFLVERLTAKCVENRVLLDYAYPAYTSRTCPICRINKASNRVAETYRCMCQGFNQLKLVNGLDADFVGAYNVRRRFLESIKYYPIFKGLSAYSPSCATQQAGWGEAVASLGTGT